MGTMEIESALVSHTELVAEAAVVGRPDDTTGEAICAFVVLKRGRPTGDEAKKLAIELRNWVGKEIGPIAKPKDIRFGDNLPKTRSGKIMRRLLRSIARVRPSRKTPARWKTRPSWNSWARLTEVPQASEKGGAAAQAASPFFHAKPVACCRATLTPDFSRGCGQLLRYSAAMRGGTCTW